jgi:hypothetical protein
MDGSYGRPGRGRDFPGIPWLVQYCNGSSQAEEAMAGDDWRQSRWYLRS